MNRFGVLTSAVIAAVVVATGLVVSPASALTTLCTGVSKADVAKCDDSGYANEMGISHWGMYKGHNCTNYTAYRLIRNGVARPSYNLGNANTWASRAKEHGVLVDAKPSVGAIGAWPGRNHVVYVDAVGPGYVITSEDNYPGYYPNGLYRKVKVFVGESAYPKQFIHFRDQMTSAVPTIAGVTTVGSTLTASAGTWAPSGVALAHKWLRDGVVVPGANAATYVLVPADVGRAMSVQVTGSKSGLTSATATSAKTAAVTAGVIGNSAAPTISGTTKVGSTLTVAPGTWSPAGVSFGYQWLRAGAVIPGATKETYELTADDLGSKISAQVSGLKDGFTTLVKTSAPTAAIAPGSLAITSPPTISGNPQVGSTLTATEGSWVPDGVSFTYQWLASGSPIAAATGDEFVPTAELVSKTISVRITATKEGFAPQSKDSAPTAQVVAAPQPLLANTRTPTVTGKSLVGTWINADNGTWSPTGIVFTYQWFRAGKAVAGGTRTTYKLTTADLGKTVAFRITGKKVGFPALAKTSKSTAVVKSPPTVGVSALPGRGNVAFVITVKAAGVTYPAGKVTIKDGTRLVKTLTLYKGRAAATLTKLTRGTHTFTIAYAGDAKVASKSVVVKPKVL